MAIDPALSCIVQAPAGSGKTTLLAQRYLKLLAGVTQPEEILAITFTKKAAAEMRERVLKELLDEDSTHGLPAMQRARAQGWNLDKYPGRLRIQTIDSFAMSLVKQLPVTSQLQQREICAHPEACYQQAVARVLNRLSLPVSVSVSSPSHADTVAALLREFMGNTGQVQSLLVTMLRRREQWQFMLMERLGNYDNESLIDSITRGIIELQQGAMTALNASLTQPLRRKLLVSAAYAADNLDAHPALSALDEFEQWRFVAGSLVFTKSADFGSPAVRRRLTKNEGFPAGAKDTQKADLLELLAEFTDDPSYAGMLAALIAIRDIPQLQAAQLDRERLAIIGTVLFDCINELGDVFVERGEVDFNQITIAAITALGSEDAPSDLALSLDYRINHLLIDEFQDTSRAQHELFSRLIREWTPGDGNSFFAVGDPMQSIYRFRNAEVSLFLDVCRNGMNGLPLKHLRLTTNFRSSNQMIAWFNQVFAVVLGDHDDQNLGAIGYAQASSPREALEHIDEKTLTAPLQISTDNEEQLSQLVTHIQSLAETDSFSDIAILVRNRTPVGQLVKALESANIPWQGTDLHALSNTAIVSDLVCLSLALFDPGDRVSAFALLRSPLVGLSLVDLGGVAKTLAKETPGSGAQSPIFTLTARSLANGLSVEGQARLQRLQEIAEPILARRLTLAPRELIEETWLRLGGPAAYPESTYKHAIRLLDVLEAGHPNHLDPQRLQRDVAGLYAEDESQGVQILTVHKSKGLQYRHVLLPFLHAGTRADDSQLLMSREASQGFLMACRKPGNKDLDKKERTLYNWLKAEDKQRARNETKRLLYVAATRAERSIALFAALADNKAPAKNSLLATLEDVFGEIWSATEDAAESSAIKAGEIKDGELPHEQNPQAPDLTVHALPATLAAPPLPPLEVKLPERARLRATPRATERAGPELDNPELLFAADRRAAILRGNLVHQALCALTRLVPQDQKTEPTAVIKDSRRAAATALIERQHPLWLQQALDMGLGSELAERVRQNTSSGIERVAQSAVGYWCALQSHKDSRAELPLTLWEGAGPMKLVVDRTFVTDSGTDAETRWIIDYKTAQPESPDTSRNSGSWLCLAE